MRQRKMLQATLAVAATLFLSLAGLQPMVSYAISYNDVDVARPELAGQWVPADVKAGDSPRWYYFKEDGWTAGGWFEYGGRLYYGTGYGVSGADREDALRNRTYHFNQEVNVANNEYYYLLEGTVDYAGNNFTVVNGFITSKNGQPVTTTTPATSDTTTPVTSNTSYWAQEAGLWYYTENGSLVKNQWSFIGGEWYYFLEDGAMATGWVQDGEQWYYLETNGAMVTGTHAIDGKECQFSESGNLTSEKPQ